MTFQSKYFCKLRLLQITCTEVFALEFEGLFSFMNWPDTFKKMYKKPQTDFQTCSRTSKIFDMIYSIPGGILHSTSLCFFWDFKRHLLYVFLCFKKQVLFQVLLPNGFVLKWEEFYCAVDVRVRRPGDTCLFASW